jgi:hypothetical protein
LEIRIPNFELFPTLRPQRLGGEFSWIKWS